MVGHVWQSTSMSAWLRYTPVGSVLGHIRKSNRTQFLGELTEHWHMVRVLAWRQYLTPSFRWLQAEGEGG